MGWDNDEVWNRGSGKDSGCKVLLLQQTGQDFQTVMTGKLDCFRVSGCLRRFELQAVMETADM